MDADSIVEKGSVRRAAQALALAYLTVFTLLVAVASAVTFLGDPYGGQSIARLDLKLSAAPGAKAASAAKTPAQNTQAVETAVPPPESQPAQGAAPGEKIPTSDQGLIEKSPQGLLPRIADNGTLPMRAYAGATPSRPGPRIAIVLNGLGMSAKATQAALDLAPAGVTFAFFPYAGDVQRWVSEARHRGHEVLLEVPMEPYDFPDSDPGRYTLRAGGGEDANMQRLIWALTRFTGYTGVTNLLGGRFLSDTGALEPVMTTLVRRGLLFYDNGSAVRSVAPDVAARAGAYFAQAATTIDSIQSAMEIDHRLSDLETVARTKGSASGSGYIYPVTVERVNIWAKGLSGRGFVLVPVSAIVTQTK